MVHIDPDEVAALVREVGASVVLPRWRSLTAGDVEEKSPGELVTSADRDAEAWLTTRLRALCPRSVVVGEEATAADPSLPDAIARAPVVWLVDPIDGTRNFVAGTEDFAVMVALVQDGECVASWIEQPARRRGYAAVRGAGAFADGRRLRVTPTDDVARLRGVALTRFLDADRRAAVRRLGDEVCAVGPGRACAGVDYPLIAEGEQDFALFWRTLPWDHAPGALLVIEAGGVVAHLDGAPYRPGERREGLVAAAVALAHATVASALCPGATTDAD